MKRIHLLLSGCVFLTASGLFALYQNVQAEPKSELKYEASMDRILSYYFKQMDLNGDEVITRGEREKTMKLPNSADFSELDLDGNGELTIGEYKKAFQDIHSRPNDVKI